jgi:hypothetical protein
VAAQGITRVVMEALEANQEQIREPGGEVDERVIDQIEQEVKTTLCHDADSQSRAIMNMMIERAFAEVKRSLLT